MSANSYEVVTPASVSVRLNLGMSVRQVADTIDLDGVAFCALCLMDLTEEIRHGRTPSPALVRRTVDWVWMESGKAVREAVVRARMEERPYAEAALRDIDANGWRSAFAEAVVLRIASQLADQLGAYTK